MLLFVHLFSLADTAKLLMAVAILFTYGLQFYIPNEILWKKISHKFNEKYHNRTQILLRTGIILISGGIAAAIPNLEPFISLVGAIFFSLLGKFYMHFPYFFFFCFAKIISYIFIYCIFNYIYRHFCAQCM